MSDELNREAAVAAADETAAADVPTMTLREAIQSAIDENEVILFMKGVPDAPACGFSARAVSALEHVGKPFAAVNILPDPRIREELSAISGWPTIPQLFVSGELIGGADIITEMYEDGELYDTLGVERPVAAAPIDAGAESQPLKIENRLS
jgi:monothiol glutaredoxin